MTQMGMILGTAAYMAPEQARGRAVDRRADLWAFGCVLYEMLTGRRAFDGEDVSMTLSQVLQREPEWEALPPSTPPVIRRLLARCLQKDPRRRLADASTAGLDIVEAIGNVGKESPSAPVLSQGRERLAWTTAVVMTVAAAIAGWWGLRQTASTPARTPSEVRLEIGSALGSYPAVSPDGTAVAYLSEVSGRSQWVVRTLATGQSTPLPGVTGDADDLIWSADSRSIGYTSGQKLRRMDIATGTVQTLADAPTSRGGTWGPDGTILFACAPRKSMPCFFRLGTDFAPPNSKSSN